MSAREKYRRPSIFAIFLAMLVNLVYQATHVHPRVPQLRLPDLRRIPVLGRLIGWLGRILRPLAAAAARAGRAAWAGIAPRLPRVKLPALKKPQWKIKRPSLPSSLKAGASRASSTVRTAAGAFASKCRDVDCRVRARRRMLLVPSILIGLGLGLYVGIPLLVPSALTAARQQSQSLFTQAEDLLTPNPVYKINVPTPPETLDPQVAALSNQTGHLQLIYEGLTRLNYRMETVPAAASDWAYSADGLQVVFTLREGLTYSDGTLLNARRFEFAMLRALDPRLSTANAFLLDGVVGAQTYRTGGMALPEDDLSLLREGVQIKARMLDGSPCSAYDQPDCRKLYVTLTAPDYAFHTRAASWITYPVKEESLSTETFLLLPAAIVGNGPFTASKIDYAGYSEFVPNPRYWGKKPGFNLQVFYTADTNTALEQYRAGTLDVLPVEDAAALAAVLADPALSQDLRRQTGACTFGIMMDASTAPFDDFNVRAAFASAINREAYVREVLGGLGVPALTWIPAGLPGANPIENRYAYDPAQARRLLAESAYHEPAALPPITVQYTDTAGNAARWNWLRDRWQDVLGVSVTLEPRPVGEMVVTPLSILGWCGDYADPANYMSFWRSGSYAGGFHYANTALDAQLDQAALQADPAERLRLYQEAQNSMLAGAPLIALYHSQQAYLFRPDLLPNGTPFDAIFPADVDPAALQVFADKKYLPMIGR